MGGNGRSGPSSPRYRHVWKNLTIWQTVLVLSKFPICVWLWGFVLVVQLAPDFEMRHHCMPFFGGAGGARTHGIVYTSGPLVLRCFKFLYASIELIWIYSRQSLLVLSFIYQLSSLGVSPQICGVGALGTCEVPGRVCLCWVWLLLTHKHGHSKRKKRNQMWKDLGFLDIYSLFFRVPYFKETKTFSFGLIGLR